MRRLIMFSCCLLTFCFSGASFAGSGPETMNLKEVFEVEGKKKDVMLPHHKHQAKVPCASCHISSAGGGSVKFDLVNKTGMSNDFHKKWCWPCHVEMKVPKGKSCTTCHTGPK